jgi:hypothetical protein
VDTPSIGPRPPCWTTNFQAVAAPITALPTQSIYQIALTWITENTAHGEIVRQQLRLNQSIDETVATVQQLAAR